MISEEGSDKVTAGSKSSVNTTSLADWPSLLLFDPGDGCPGRQAPIPQTWTWSFWTSP